jgi:hypothetical protein
MVVNNTQKLVENVLYFKFVCLRIKITILCLRIRFPFTLSGMLFIFIKSPHVWTTKYWFDDRVRLYTLCLVLRFLEFEVCQLKWFVLLRWRIPNDDLHFTIFCRLSCKCYGVWMLLTQLAVRVIAVTILLWKLWVPEIALLGQWLKTLKFVPYFFIKIST